MRTDWDDIVDRESRYRRMRNHDYFWYFAIGVVAVVILVIGVTIFQAYSARHTRNVVVTGKERVCHGGNNGGCDYLVFTDGGTFKVGDSLVAMRFNSSDIYGQIAECHRYDLTYYGWRIPILSDYPNITNMNDLGRAEGCTPR